MKNNIYCLYDTLSLRYGSVYAFATDGMALRSLLGSVEPKKIKAFMQEQQLCRIGAVDIENGVCTPEPAPVRLDWSSSPMLETLMEEVS